MIINGKDHGIQTFMVPMRSLKDHTYVSELKNPRFKCFHCSLLPGVEAGDIGPKIGYNNQDNGYCRFDHVRIPRNYLGMRHIVVEAGGKISKRREGTDAKVMASSTLCASI